VTLTASTLTEVYDHPIDVVPHPVTGTPLALPAA
jgi:iron complex transport system ATP-binding protein